MPSLPFTSSDLDAYNFRSDIRRLGRQYLDNDLEDTRVLNSAIAHYANLLLQVTIAYVGVSERTVQQEAFIAITRDASPSECGLDQFEDRVSNAIRVRCRVDRYGKVSLVRES